MTDHNCPPREDGLSHCSVCGGAEASLTKHCVGRKLTEGEEIAVMAGALDFKNGKWVNPNRQTYYETVPISVTGVDILDRSLTGTIKELRRAQADNSRLGAEALQNSYALRYARARIKLEDPDAVACMTHEEKAAANIELKRARKDYLESLERDDSY